MKSLIHLLILIPIIGSSSSYLTPEPIKWEKLVELQKNVIYEKDYKSDVSPFCSLSSTSYEGISKVEYLQTILWTTYRWDRYLMPDGLNCYFLDKDLLDGDSSMQLLSEEEVLVLLSASNEDGFDSNELYDFAEDLNHHNRHVSAKILQKVKEVNNKYQNHHSISESQHVIAYDGYKEVKLFQYFNLDFEDSSINETLFEDSKDLKTGSRFRITHEDSFQYPANNVTNIYPRDLYAGGDCGLGQGTAFFLTSNVALTNGHNLYKPSCGGFAYSVDSRIAEHYHPEINSSVSHYGSILAANMLISDEWFQDARIPNPNDFGAVRFNQNIIFTSNIAITNSYSISQDDRLYFYGYPDQRSVNNFGMWFYAADYIPSTGLPFIDNILAPNQIPFDTYPYLVEGGMSGSPVHEYLSPYTFGMVTLNVNERLDDGTVGNSGKGIINAFTAYQISKIQEWLLYYPTVHILFSQPTTGVTYNLVDLPDWSVIVTNINKIDIDGKAEDKGDLEHLVQWESSVDGNIGSGASLSKNSLKAILSGGNHYITAKIDSDGEQGEAFSSINIIRPNGKFTSKDFCILDLTSNQSNSCQINVSWSVTNTPRTSVVWNETEDIEFASGNNGNQPFIATTDTTVLKLYPSDEKIILLDTLNAQAKVPTGDLTVPAPQCSLQPSPVAPNGTARDPKATPPGCGTELKWSNVQWASPSIYYRPVGSGSWQFLHQVPCALNGEVCSGSIHTDDYTPELIPASGYEFKLVQFNDPNSGNLTAPFVVTAKRYADDYEFDDGFYELGTAAATTYLSLYGNITTPTILNVPQHNHNFHRPAAYDSGIDKDTFHISTDKMINSTQLEVEIFNMAPDLRVNFAVQCAGQRFIDNGEDRTDVWDIPESPIVSSTYDAANRKTTMRFNVVKDRTYNVQQHPGSSGNQWRLLCQHNRVVVNRTAGQAGEDLSYSIVVRDANQTNGPVLDSVAEIGTQSYKVELLGDNFGANPSISVRDINSSQPYTAYSSSLFHNQGTHSSSHQHAGKNFIRFPILNKTRQDIFRSRGLCFKVINGANESNEQCYTMPDRTPKPLFMGAELTSYNEPNRIQDADSDAYVVKTSGNLLKIWGNSWKKLPIDYTVTPNTELTMSFKSTHSEGEIIGVGFIMAGQSGLSGARFWQIHGNQPGGWGHQDHHDYTGTAYKTYTIKVGQKFTGQVSHMVFVADYDNQQAAQNVVFQLPTLSENNSNIDIYDDVPAQRAFDDDVKGQAVAWIGGDTVHSHTFHDVGDVDWTIVHTNEFRARTELVGSGADTKLSIYRWISADENQSTGYYENVVDEFVGMDESPGASEFTVYGVQSHIYAIKVESLNNVVGQGSSYRLILEAAPPFQPDAYDDVPAQRAFDDDVNGRASLWTNGLTLQAHNFHDVGDVDWTIIHAEDFRVRTELLGSNSDTKLSLYKWISATPNSNLGYYENVTDVLVEVDNSIGPSEIVNFNTEPSIYAAKVESRNGAYAAGTNYNLIFSTLPNGAQDSYEVGLGVSGFTDDTEGTASSWVNGDTIHQHNFHDNGDVDWTIVYAQNFTAIADAVGEHADIKMTVYKWISADTNAGYYTNIVKQQVGLDSSPGDSVISVNENELTIYSIKVESRNGAFGNQTNYTLRLQ